MGCCGKKTEFDYSGINRIPYFGKRKDRDAWLKKRKPNVHHTQDEQDTQKIEQTTEVQIDRST